MPPRRSTSDKRSTLRDRHAETTRTLVLDALVARLAETGGFEVSYFDLARRAGISVRTIYRHFPTREALVEALGRRVSAAVGIREYPRTREGVVAIVKALFETFDRHAPLLVAQIQAGRGGLRAKARHKRVGALQEVLAATTSHVPVDRRRAVAGLLACLMSANSWQFLRAEAGLDGTQSGEVIAWAIDTLWRALETEDDRARRRA